MTRRVAAICSGPMLAALMSVTSEALLEQLARLLDAPVVPSEEGPERHGASGGRM
jgi:hypothetical protein